MIIENLSCNTNYLSRFTMMLTQEQQTKLLTKRIIVFGVGGVGGALVHMLVRSGIQNIAIVDFDKIDITNINRQLIANHKNIGELKVEELKKQLLDINPSLNIKVYPLKLSHENINCFSIEEYDYVVDCIDDIPAKKLLIKHANEKQIPILCAMGAGNRFAEVPQFEIADIKKTSYDPIAKILRKFCAQERINKLKVCYTKQKAIKFDCKIIGSVVYYPINMASVMCSKVINDIIS